MSSSLLWVTNHLSRSFTFVRAWSTTPTRLSTRTTQHLSHFSFGNNHQPFYFCHDSSTTTRLFSTQSNEEKKRKKSIMKKKKIKINKEISQQQAAANLAAAFDDLAKKEGFEASSHQQFFANDSTFEDQFTDDDFVDDDAELDDGDELDDNDKPPVSPLDAAYWGDPNADNDGLDDDGGPVVGQAHAAEATVGDFHSDRRQQVVETDQDDDDYLDFGSSDDDDDMEARIAAAQSDLNHGRVTVDPTMDDITKDDMRRLGFRQELNPFEGDHDTPRQDDFRLITHALSCSACGADFQARNASRPGYLPPEKFDVQQKLAHLEELRQLQEKAHNKAEEWSPEDEVEWLLRTSAGTDLSADNDANSDEIDIDAVAEEMGIDLAKELSREKKVICQRCHYLQNFGQVDEALRPGWTDEPLMSQDKFRDLLKPLATKPAVLIAIVDLFDFSGSVLPELDAIAGTTNPVIIAANKADLLPTKMGQQRAEHWVRRELNYMGVTSLANNKGGTVRLVSCKTGMGISSMLAKARKLAESLNCDVYVVGAANAGKSTLMNYILRKNDKASSNKHKRKRAGNANARKGALTTSPLPGTTLKFIKVDLGSGRSIYDTPGLLVPGTLTQLLTPDELKIVVPNKQVEPITFRIEAGKCVQVGGLARISVIGDSKPFLFTFFVANQIKLHPTDQSRADEFVAKHAGGMLTPPLEPGPERMKQIGEFETHVVEIEGSGWKEAAADITLTGLGWVAVTGPGTALVEIKVPKGIAVQMRPPLMPFDMWESTARYTGSRAVRKSGKSLSGKRRKGVGRN